MFGRILEITENRVVIENISGKVQTSILGVHVVFEEKVKILGEISAVDDKTITCTLVGEFIDGVFQGGLDHRISPDATITAVKKK